MNSNFIPCAKWVQRGVAKAKPGVMHFSKEDMEKLLLQAKNDILETAEEIKSSCEGETGTESAINDQGLQDVDKEDDVQSLIGFGNLITVGDEDLLNAEEEEDEDNDEDDSEKEDDEIKPTDNLLAVGHVHGDISILEVYVFNEEDNDLYVHHDVVLPTVPLCLEWLNHSSLCSDPGNLLALGGMSPEITLWDLNVVNSLEPVAQLGSFSSRKKHQHRNYGHRDAVLDLSWNAKLPHVLASASVDRSVLLWDLDTGKAVSSFRDFRDKVQTLQWHPLEVNILAAAACDSSVRMLDCRVAESVHLLDVDGEVEKVLWHPSSQFSILVGTSKGELVCADCRSGEVLWSVAAHDKELTGLVVSRDKVVSCSTDETVKVWSVSQSGPCQLLYSKHLHHGELQCLQACPDNTDILCVGGTARDNNFKVFNIVTEMEKSEQVQEMDVS